MVHLNLVLWITMLGATLAPGVPGQLMVWIAAAGLTIAALWEHSAVRGLATPKRTGGTT
jgi:hypothetical protein